MHYLKIKLGQDKQHLVEDRASKLFRKLISLILPVSNPDFEDKFMDVSYWLLEFEDELQTPIREIGVDKNNDVILKMPYLNNYGYWTDNSLNYADFVSRFETQTIEVSEFNSAWDEYV